MDEDDNGKFRLETVDVFIFCRLWEEAGLETCEELCLQILPDLMHHESVIRTATAEALGTIAEEYPDNIDALVTTITDLYHEKLKVGQNNTFLHSLSHYLDRIMVHNLTTQ